MYMYAYNIRCRDGTSESESARSSVDFGQPDSSRKVKLN